MVRKVDYNNPIMKQYIARGQKLSANSGCNCGSKYSMVAIKHGFGGGVRMNPPSKTTVIVKESESSSSSSSSSSMSTAEKIAAGFQLTAAGLKAATSVVDSILDVVAKNNVNTESTTNDAPVYDSSASAVKSDVSASKKIAKETSKAIDEAIKDYKSSGNIEPLKDAVGKAKGDKSLNDASIEKFKAEIKEKQDDYETVQDEYNKYHEGEYKTAKTNKENTQKEFETTKKANDAKISDLEKENESLSGKITSLGEEVKSLQSQLEGLDSSAEDYETQKAKIEQDIKEKTEEIEAKKKEIEDNNTEVANLKTETQKAQDKRDEAIKEFNDATTIDDANKATMLAAKADYTNVKSDNEKEIRKFESINKDLEKAIETGNKALGAYAEE